MIRVLHVRAAAAADHETACGVEHLSAPLGADFNPAAFTIGPGGYAPNVPAAIVALRRRAARPDVVHCWGFAALTAAAFAGRTPIVFSPPPGASARQVRWLRAVMSYRDVHVTCTSATARKTLVARGLPPARCHLVRPGIDPARLRPRSDRDSLRAALGAEPGHELLLLPGESTRGADHRQGVWAATIVNILDRRTRLLTWGRGSLAPAVAAFAARLDQPELLIDAGRRLGRAVEFEELCTAADALLVPATAPVATLPIATAMAAGLPAVAAVTPTVAELLEDGRTALTAPPGVPRLLAKRILDLRRDENLRHRLVEAARAAALESFSLTRFLDQHRSIYQQAAARPAGAAGGGVTSLPA